MFFDLYSLFLSLTGVDNKTAMSERIEIVSMKQVTGLYELEISTLKSRIVVTADLVHRHRLKAGIIITQPQLEQLLEESEQARCDQYVTMLLGRREHSTYEIRQKLRRKQFEPKAIDTTLRRFSRNGLLDDNRFAANLARRTLEQKPAGHMFIKAVLLRKGIPGEIAERVVGQLLADKDETDLARKALERKWRQWREIDVETARKRAYNYLSRRGIGYQAARTAFDELSAKLNEVNKDQDG